MATKEDDEVMLVTKHGQAIRFALSEVRQMGRNASGVIGIRLRSGDEVVSAVAVEDDKHLLVVSTEGFGKRTEFSEFSCKHRGGYGMKGFKVVEERGEVVGALGAGEEDEILLITSSGTMIRTSVSDVSVQGRAASGVRVMRPREGDSVKAITPASPLENGEEEELVAEGIVEEAAEGADLGADPEAASTEAASTEAASEGECSRGGVVCSNDFEQKAAQQISALRLSNFQQTAQPSIKAADGSDAAYHGDLSRSVRWRAGGRVGHWGTELLV